jgi:hypothetical protein
VCVLEQSRAAVAGLDELMRASYARLRAYAGIAAGCRTKNGSHGASSAGLSGMICNPDWNLAA